MGQWHEIFDFRFFHESVSPKALSIPSGTFRICSSRCVGKFATGVVDASGARWFANFSLRLFSGVAGKMIHEAKNLVGGGGNCLNPFSTFKGRLWPEPLQLSVYNYFIKVTYARFLHNLSYISWRLIFMQKEVGMWDRNPSWTTNYLLRIYFLPQDMVNEIPASVISRPGSPLVWDFAAKALNNTSCEKEALFCRRFLCKKIMYETRWIPIPVGWV